MVDELADEPEQLVDQPVDPVEALGADPRVEQLARLVGELDLEGLFGYLLAERGDLTSLMAALDGAPDGLGDALDGLAEAYPEHFVGWYQWCGDNDVQGALASRYRIAAVLGSWPAPS
jgi:hypothetical protein